MSEFLAAKGAIGASLVSRDGICVMTAAHRDLNEETFAAMSATLMGAAEIALSDMSAGRTLHVLTEAENVRLVVMSISEEFILVTLADKQSPFAALVESAGKTATGVSKLLAG